MTGAVSVAATISHHMSAITSGVSTSIATVRGNFASLQLKIDSLPVHLGPKISDLFLQGSNLFYIRVGCIQQGVEFL
jgi:hypothetical protein